MVHAAVEQEFGFCNGLLYEFLLLLYGFDLGGEGVLEGERGEIYTLIYDIRCS